MTSYRRKAKGIETTLTVVEGMQFDKVISPRTLLLTHIIWK